jgi:hypothetical protein
MIKVLAITTILFASIQLHAQPLSQLEERDLLLRFNTHFYPHLLPNSAVTLTHAKCGTPLILELKTKWPRLSKPISDGDEYYDIYIQSLGGQSVYGWAYQDAGTLEITTSSCIVIDNNFTENIYATRGLNGLQVTAAHEFFHAVQFAYYANANASWWQELTATWMEDIAYDQINDYYQYLPQFFNEPTTSLNRFSGIYHFGASVFAHHLHQIYGIDAIRSVWESLADLEPRNDSLPAINAGLSLGGFKDLLPRFALWNYLTGDRSGYYEEARNYPSVPLKTLTPGVSITNSLGHLAYDYIHINTSTLSSNLHLNFDLDPDAQWNILIAHFRGSRIELTYTDNPQINIPNPSRFDHIICIPTVTNLSGEQYKYTCTATPSTASGLAISLVGDLKNYGRVEFADFLNFSVGFGAKPTTPTYRVPHDLNGDGTINLSDFLIFVSHFGESRSTF